jgi:hypothetical protein
VSNLVHLSGPEDYPRWLHMTRVDMALAARRAAEITARLQASTPRCFCGRAGTQVGAAGWYGSPRRPVPVVYGRGEHLAVLTFKPAERLAERTGREVLDDGRTVSDAVDDVLDRVFDEVPV